VSLAVVNIGDSHRGSLDGAPIPGDAVVCEDGAIAWIGRSGDVARGDVRTLVDAGGAALVPGFIDSHVHLAFGDYTPRQRTVGFLESYLHGGVTTAISASEVHVPGRPTDVAGVMALAVAAQRAYQDYRPGGVRAYGGSVILEPGLEERHFRELREAGVWLAKAGFGSFTRAEDYVATVRAARQAGLKVMCHCGGASIGGTLEVIDAELLLAMRPDVLGHVNGGPTSLSPEDGERLVREATESALQLVHAGNLRSAIHLAGLAIATGQESRLLIASDTPTGTGVIPLAILRSMAELVSLGPLSPAVALAAATGNVSQTYGLAEGILDVGRPADLLLIDAPVGSQAADWRAALAVGDLPAVGLAVTAGKIRFTRSRNTPPPRSRIEVSPSGGE